MSYENVGKGFLMKVDQKKSDRAPDYSGRLEMQSGEVIQVSGWIEESKSGKKYLSLALQVEADERPSSPRQASHRASFDDDVPF
jgi:uncharacterized protein (DUF736 family)